MPLSFAFFAIERADGFGRRRVRRPCLPAVLVARRRGRERLAAGVVDHLGVDVLEALEHREARTLGRAADLAADPLADPASGNSRFARSMYLQCRVLCLC